MMRGGAAVSFAILGVITMSGSVRADKRGATTAHVRIDIGNGVIVTSSITNEAVDDLGLSVGDHAIAVIKASDVMVAK